jgi:hypothetical protein
MKRPAILLFLLLITLMGIGQSTGSYWKVSTLSTPLGRALGDSTQVYVKSTYTWYQLTRGVPDTMTMQKAIDSSYCFEITKNFIQKSELFQAFGGGVDTLLISTVGKFAMGYSSGVVIDTVIYIATTTGSETVNVTPKLFYGTDIETGGTAIISSPSAVTSHTVATKISTFDNGTIEKGNIVWLTFSQTTTIPKNFTVIVIGHRQ